ncbi:hypothetical protein [Candidatus Amarolinea aalborgensis]
MTYETSGFLAAYTCDDDGNIQTMADAAATRNTGMMRSWGDSTRERA